VIVKNNRTKSIKKQNELLLSELKPSKIDNGGVATKEDYHKTLNC